jgi:hypothetical protein
VLCIISEKEKKKEKRGCEMQGRFPVLSEASEEQRAEAYRRYELIRVCVEEGVSQRAGGTQIGCGAINGPTVDSEVPARWIVWIDFCSNGWIVEPGGGSGEEEERVVEGFA